MSNVPNQVNINEDTPNQVIINQDSPNQVLVRGGGIGGSSANTRRHVHTQGVSSNEWVITHTLGGKPSVTIVDSADTLVIGEVKYDSNTQVTVSFTSAFSGFAYLT
jgi:hypothetical protein